MKEAYIYCVTNLINGKVYVGQHDGSKSHYYASGTLIQQAIKKYGKGNFKRDIIIKGYFSQQELDALETKYIAEYRSHAHQYPDRGYNLTSGGQGRKDYIASLETKQKLSENNPLRKPIIQFTLEGEEVARYHSTLDVSRKLGLNNANVYRACSGERPQAGGFLWLFERDYVAGKKPVYVPAQGPFRKVAQYDLTGKLVTTFNSITEAAKATSIARSGISNCLCGIVQRAGDYQWCYLNGDCIMSITKHDPTIPYQRMADKAKVPVIQRDASGNIIAEYSSAMDVAKKLGVHQATVRSWCRGDSSSPSGLSFEYKAGAKRRKPNKNTKRVAGTITTNQPHP